jgi:hypothetical protein
MGRVASEPGHPVTSGGLPRRRVMTDTVRLVPCVRCRSELLADASACPFCGADRSEGGTTHSSGLTSDPSDLDIMRAALAEDYDIAGELGRGGMAIVLRGRERALDREVAIKVLPLSHSFDAEFVERFQNEARTAAKLEHPNIVPIYRVGRAGRVIYFVMKYLRGGSVSGMLQERGTLPPAEIRRLLCEVGGALHYAAERGVVHRDIKPDNIMIDESGRFIVTDFGIAKSATGQRMTATGMSVGTPRYMSPEQARAKELDGRSDIYSLGVVAYECLVGRVPFDAAEHFAIMLAHVQQPVPRPALPTPEHERLYRIIEGMLAKDANARIQGSDELLGVLDRDLPVDRTLAVASEERATVRVVAEGSRRMRAVAWVMATRARMLKSAAAAVIALALSAYSGHVAIMHRSRCPSAAAANGADSGGQAARTLTLMVDAVTAHDWGEALDVYYDVCGLDAGTAYHVDVAVTSGQSGLRKLLGGGSRPVRVSYDEVAGGPRERHHRTVDTGELDPGSYSLTIVLSDESGRIRERRQDFRITE